MTVGPYTTFNNTQHLNINFHLNKLDIYFKNSRLLNNGDKRGWFSDVAGNQKNYWPGGLGETNKCACAITGTCQSGI